MKMRMRRVLGAAGILGLGLSLALADPAPLDAQARRGLSQRQTPTGRDDAAAQRRQQQGRLLLDRFAQRVGQALHLDEAATQRLMRELQASRAERGRIQAQIQAIRRDLAQLIQESPADEDRIAGLMDEAFELEVRHAEVGLDEQRRLAEFLSPLQRARLIWFQQQAARQALQRSDRPIRF